MEEQVGYCQIWQYFVKLNLFETEAADQVTIGVQRWSTRIYLLLLFIGLSIVLVYNGIRMETQQLKVNNPSLATYMELQEIYDTTIKCPCTQISILTSSFAAFLVEYHDICTSQFISQKWIDLLFTNTTFWRFVVDFRATASNQFQVLRELCDLSQTTINNNIENFHTETFISGYLLNERLFLAQTKAMTDRFQTDAVTDFFQRISFYRSFTIGNTFMSGIQTPYTLLIYTNDDVNWYLNAQLNYFKGMKNLKYCTCDVNTTCHLPAGFYDIESIDDDGLVSILTINATYTPDNWFMGCWPLESLVQSSLTGSFLSNQSALYILAMHLNIPVNSTPMALTGFNMTNENNTFDQLLETSFVSRWSPYLNYSAYFAQCQPQVCTYTIAQRSSFLYILTSLLGLYGGLSVVLRLLVPYMVSFIHRCVNRTPSFDNTDNNNTDIAVKKSWFERFQTLLQLLWHSIIHLNLFSSSFRQQPSDIKQQRWMTRLYIVWLTFALVILIFYLLLRSETKLIEVTNPSLTMAKELQQSQSQGLVSSLQCPCAQLTVPYGALVHLQPIYHQVCSSDFVSSRWITAVSRTIRSGDTPNYYRDFHNSAALFQLLKSLCTFSNNTIVSALEIFEQIQLISADLLSVDLFTNQILSAIDQFKLETVNDFQGFLQIMRNLTFVNQLLTGAHSNYDVRVNATSIPPTAAMYPWGYNNDNASFSCACANDPSCKVTTGLYSGTHGNWVDHYTVPGLYTACFPVESLLQSTLECFYDNQVCLSFLFNYYNVSSVNNFTLLNSSSSASHYLPNATVGSLLAELFIEYWNGSPNYSAYFVQCQPTLCSYQTAGKNTVIEAITQIVSLIGGLSVSLRLLTSIVIAIFISIIQRTRRQQNVPDQSVSRRLRLKTFAMQIRTRLEEFNVFENPYHTRNIHRERLATRLYVVILCISLFILIIYTTITYSVTTFTVQNPSLDQFKQMQQRYGSYALNCPCTQLANVYSSFVDLKCSFHQVCTSQFVSKPYLQELYRLYNALDVTNAAMNVFTLQGTVFIHFQSLLVLCNLGQDAVNDARQKFLASSFISTNMIDFQLFDKLINSSLTSFLGTLPNSFLNALQLIRGMTQANGLVSTYTTNWYPIIRNLSDSPTIFLHPQHYGSGNCTCATSSTCTQSSIPFLPGYLVGCTPLESILRSTIECLYEESCVNLLTTYVNTTLHSFTALNATTTRFASNDSIDSIVQEMFIETCSPNISYERFFDACHPLSCLVTLNERNSFILVLTILLGLYGGLTTFLKLAVPSTLSWIYELKERCKRRTAQIHQDAS
ncbi:unnamed protein product [Adineta steineri]|uniref:Uncharacterized protein n=1 Tax=Adineta steineri TaxID=433720 RepID=A0A818UI74_9BILA|nr:unnamed protein product [Adineta steineri]